MSERPTAQELSEAILEFLGGEILPTLTDHRLRFRMLVAMNALGIVYRELDGSRRKTTRSSASSRRGSEPAMSRRGRSRRVKTDVEARLRIASPSSSTRTARPSLRDVHTTDPRASRAVVPGT